VGESPKELMGHSRQIMVWLPWVAMMAISVFEYGYGAAADTLQKVHGWSMGQTFWIVTIWAVFQAGIAFPAGRLRERNIFSARAAMIFAAFATAIGFLTITHVSNLALVWLGYSVIGGSGAGLVYATCINMVGKWFPEKKGARTGFVNGGFAYGAVPFIYVFSYWYSPSNFAPVMNSIAAYMFILLFACGLLFRDPPKNWWPAEVDPREWRSAATAAKAKSLAKNPPATAQFGPLAALRTGQLPLLWFGFFLIASVSLFGSAYQVPFAKHAGFSTFIVAGSAGVLSVVNGVGRFAIGWFSDLVGRKQALLYVMVIEGIAQFGLLWSGDIQNQVLFVFFAFVAGFGGGAFFPLYAAITPDYFGENTNAQNYGIVYSAKLASAIVGIGIGSTVIDKLGYSGAYITGGIVAFAAAAVIVLYKQPGDKYHYLIPEADRPRRAVLPGTPPTAVTD
jgi:MFS family permease